MCLIWDTNDEELSEICVCVWMHACVHTRVRVHVHACVCLCAAMSLCCHRKLTLCTFHQPHCFVMGSCHFQCMFHLPHYSIIDSCCQNHPTYLTVLSQKAVTETIPPTSLFRHRKLSLKHPTYLTVLL